MKTDNDKPSGRPYDKPKGQPKGGKDNAFSDFLKKCFEQPEGTTPGRPRLYATAEELQEKIVEFFDYCNETKMPVTISGLVLYTGFADRSSFYDYEKNSLFTYTIKRAREAVAMHYEYKLNGDQFPTGAIFALKNLGWKAEEQTESTNKTVTEFYIGDQNNEPSNDNE